MASLYTSRVGVTTNLSNGSPFSFDSLQDASSAPVNRHQQRGPLQHGVSDLGYRVQPRELTLSLLFYAATDSALDTHRQTLMDAFSPLTDISTFLYYERDDGTTLRLTVFTVGEIEIDLIPEHRPGHLHRATLKLRAANPFWVNPTVNQSTLADIDDRSWWTAGGTISLANVMEYTEYPTQGQAWTYTGTIASSSWAIVYRTTLETLGSAIVGTPTIFHAGTGALGGTATNDARFYLAGTAFWIDGSAPTLNGTALIRPFERNYAIDATKVIVNGSVSTGPYSFNPHISGTARRWRSDKDANADTYWAAEMPKVAIYNTSLTTPQHLAISAWMDGTASTPGSIKTSGSAYVVNSGDARAYPVIKFTGPLSNPILVNTMTGGSLNLTGLTLGTSAICTVDLRDGNKQILDANGNNLMGSLTYPIHLADWYLAPDPLAPGGTNTIVLTVTGPSSTTRAFVEHYDQYMSY